MSRLQEAHYKDRSPEETVALVKRILDEIGIPLEEKELQRSKANTWSMRVEIPGTGVGTNGKGVTEAYCRASAYAEFMERLQNGMLTEHFFPWDGEGCFYHPDEQFLSVSEAVRLDNAAVNTFFASRGMEDATPLERELYVRANCTSDLHNANFLWSERCRREREPYVALPFYSVRKRRVEIVPQCFYSLSTGSNGMAAGNTPQEALVQGLSEIVERYIQKKLFAEKPGLPDVPDEYIRRYPYIWERMEMLRKLPGYRVMMKDCSFGGRYPVAALVIIEQNTGRYSIKPGCHPDFGIAMERTITEMSQGMDFDSASHRSMLDFENRGIGDEANLFDTFSHGLGAFPCELLSPEPTWEFTPVREVSGMDNRQLLSYMLDILLEEGYDVLIRDVSYSGFYSFHIVVPGATEIMSDVNALVRRAENTRRLLIPYWLDPRQFDARTVKLALGCMGYYGRAYLFRKLRSYMFVCDFDYPGEECGLGWLYVMAMCCFYLGRFKEAAGMLSALARAVEDSGGEKAGFYRIVYYYVQARGTGMEHEKAVAYLKQFFDGGLCGRVDELFREQTQVLAKQYPCTDLCRADGLVVLPEGPDSRFQVYQEKLRAYISERPISQERVAEYL